MLWSAYYILAYDYIGTVFFFKYGHCLIEVSNTFKISTNDKNQRVRFALMEFGL